MTADKVVLALPFSILRSVDYSEAGLLAVKQTAIQELAMGTNSKLHLQFTSRLWEGLGSNGATYADTGLPEHVGGHARRSPGTAGHPRRLHGRNDRRELRLGTPCSAAKQFLGQIEPVLPGSTAQWNGTATLDFWPGYPWTKGSYSYWKVGPVHEVLRRRGASSRATATSPASTRRSTSRAT